MFLDLWVNPLNGLCPDGYTHKPTSINDEKTDCDGNSGGYCVKKLSEVKEFCKTRDCLVISETSHTGWRIANPDSVSITVGSSRATKTSVDWAACVKDVGKY